MRLSSFSVSVPNPDQLAYADLRVGISRSGGKRGVSIALNGETLTLPEEDAAERTDNGEEYATCRIVRLDPEQVKRVNTITVSFPDGGDGGVGGGRGGGGGGPPAADAPPPVLGGMAADIVDVLV